MSFRSAHRDVSWIVVAKSVSWLGDLLAEVALVLRLQAHGAGAGPVAALLIANALPIVLLASVVGRVVDRFDNRRLLLASSLAQASLCAVVAFVSSTPRVLGLVALLGIGQAVNSACWQALLATIASGDALTRAIGHTQAGQTIAGIVAPAVSGVLVGTYGARVPLLADAIAYLAVAAAATLIATRRVGTALQPGEARRAGLAIVRADSLLRPLFILLGLFVLLGCMVNVIEVFLVRETLSASTTWFGITGATLSAGALAGALLGTRLRGAAGLARGFVGAAVLLAVGLVAAGLVPTIDWLLPPMALVGVMNGVLNVTLGSLVMSRPLAAERGRVSALLTGVASGTQLLAFAAGGTLASVFTPREIFVAAGVLGMLVPLALGPRLLRTANVVTGSVPEPALATVTA
jgi:MFS family permease